MKVGIIGLPTTGKTTLFNALTHGEAPVTEFGGRRSEANIGTITVPDARFDHIVRASKPKKISPAHIEVIDGAAPVGVETQHKFGTDFFTGIRAVDALIHVVRAFENPTHPAPEGGLDPLRDFRKVNDELTLADLGLAETRLERIEKSLHGKKVTAGGPQTIERDLMQRIVDQIENERPLNDLELSADEAKVIKSFDFLTQKPMIVVANVGEDQIGRSDNLLMAGLKAYCESEGLDLIELAANIEMEVAQLPVEEEKEYLEALGIEQPAQDRVVRSAYRALGVMTFFTTGEEETHAWTIEKGLKASEAAGKIHSDLERGFIRGEIVSYDDFAKAGSWEAAKAAGLMRLETKDYLIKDGDIMLVRFKV